MGLRDWFGGKLITTKRRRQIVLCYATLPRTRVVWQVWRRGWEDNIKINLEEIGYESMD
jgi:hypothetical protein